MKKSLLIILIVLNYGQMTAQKESVWQKISQSQTSNLSRARQNINAEGEQYYTVNVRMLKQTLANAADTFSKKSGVEVFVPNAKGNIEKFLVWENSNFAPELQAKYPEIRSYRGIGVTDKTAFLSFSLSPAGIQTMIFRADSDAEFIEPFNKTADAYVLFTSKNSNKGKLPFNCGTVDTQINQDLINQTGISNRSNTQIYKTMRLALSCTGEYGAYFGGTVAGALAGMNATMTRCNGVFEKDLAVHMNIIATDDLVIYTDGATDPYSDAATGSTGTWNAELQNNLTLVLGNSAYDIGHLFGASGGGGNAGCIGCVCVDDTASTTDKNKGSGFTSPSDDIPAGDTFDIDYVVHEMGHQMGANHTFTHSSENNSVNVEPGSGSTIMGYAGITVTTDVQMHSDPYYVYASILQIQTNLATKSCPVSVPTTNTKPTISAGSNWTVPKGTPYILTGTGSDPDGNTLTYNWEENDDATSVGATACFPSATKTNGPNYRSVNPSATPVRYMPAFSTVLNGATSSTWETVSTVARVQKFMLTGRDNVVANGQTNSASINITTSASIGPFAVTSQNTDGVSWAVGSSQTITWSVNTTSTMTGAANVNILLSIDGGATFTTLVANTPNDGTETITVPNTPSINCRLMIQPTAHIFYAVNAKPFSIGFSVVNNCNTYTDSSPLVFVDQPAGSYTTRTLTLPASTETISDVNVSMKVTHTYLSDVQTDISSPTNPSTFIKLLNRKCTSTNGSLNLKFSDGAAAINCTAGGTTLQTVAPAESLASFNGQNSEGVWTFRVYDNYSPDTGTINSWAVEVCTQTITPLPLATTTFELSNFTIFPNPNNGNFTVQFDSANQGDVNIVVNDLRGRNVFSKTYTNTGLFSQNLQLDAIQTGIYLVTVKNGDRQTVKKIVIE